MKEMLSYITQQQMMMIFTLIYHHHHTVVKLLQGFNTIAFPCDLTSRSGFATDENL